MVIKFFILACSITKVIMKSRGIIIYAALNLNFN